MASSVLDPSRAWRPQSFGRRSFRDVDDPLIEPLWSGVRVLAHVADGTAVLVDAAGDLHADGADASIAAAVAAAVQADAGVLDGYLTWEATRTGEGVVAVDPEEPRKGAIVRQMFLGGTGRSNDRRAELATLEERADEAPDGEALVFVAVDLLSLDGEALLDAPLLERKRLLDAILVEGDLVRRGVHVRPPIDPWLPTWKAIGFRGLAYKAANSRYRPGEPNDAWATAPMPRR